MGAEGILLWGIGGGGTNGVISDIAVARGGERMAVLIVICGAFGFSFDGTDTFRGWPFERPAV